MTTVPNFDTHQMEVTHWHCDCLGHGVGFVISLGQCKCTIRVRIIELKENLREQLWNQGRRRQ